MGVWKPQMHGDIATTKGGHAGPPLQ
jgi:hypothetical protein